MTRLFAALAIVLGLAAPGAPQGAHLLVVVGLGGDEENARLFHGWAAALVDAARDRHKLPAESVVYLGEDPARDPARLSGRATREEIEGAVDRLAARARPGDRVLVVLIGHGGSATGDARFNLPGPDLTAADFARLMDRLKAQLVTFVNTASASGPFVRALAGHDRVVIAATRTEGERNQTRFGEFFVEALTASEADLDKDGRVSMLEAFTWARQRVADAYRQQGQLLTEHAVLDDDGDGKGSDASGQAGTDGALARTLFMDGDTGRAAPDASADPALRALHEQRRAIEDRISALKASKGRVDEARYERELEQLLIDLARKTREIREKEKK
jgi:hypothetical protein